VRGDPLHKYQAEYLGGISRSFPVMTYIEYPKRKNDITDFLDVFIELGPFQLAIEIETTRRHLLDNARKAHALGIPVWFVVPTRKLRTQALKMLKPLNLRPGGQAIKVFLLAPAAKELKDLLSSIILANNGGLANKKI